MHERVRAVFQRSLAFARQAGYFRSRKITVVLDTSYILGRGAVKDTYNLLADGIGKLCGRWPPLPAHKPEESARMSTASARYFGSSLKGEAGIDWDDPEARAAFLGGVVADADRLLEVARGRSSSFPPDAPKRGGCMRRPSCSAQLLLQDIERRKARGSPPAGSQPGPGGVGA